MGPVFKFKCIWSLNATKIWTYATKFESVFNLAALALTWMKAYLKWALQLCISKLYQIGINKKVFI